MTDSAVWSAAAEPGRRIGHAVEFHRELGSTNDRARTALTEPGGVGRAVVADLQTAGRGRRGRSWISPPGVNLMLSVGLRPQVSAERAWWLAGGAVLAVVEACRPWAGLRLKWPNDLVAPDGRKVAGLLLETAVADGRLLEAVLGIGINVNWRGTDMPAEIADGTTSLVELSGRTVERVRLLGRLLGSLDAEMGRIEAGDSPAERYAAISILDGRRVDVVLGEQEIGGVARGIDADGSLVVDGPRGTVAIAYGEVVRVRESAEVPA